MDKQAVTDQRRTRPLITRSQTASPEISPPHSSSRISSQVARKLYLHTHSDPKDGVHRDRSHRQHAHTLHHSPGRAIVEIAKSKVSGIGADNNQNESMENANSSASQRDVDVTDIEREGRLQVERDEELHSSLNSLTHLANAVTRRLDGIYYAILEKASLLRSAVDSLQKLLSDCSDLRNTFEQDASELKMKTRMQVAEFGAFQNKKKEIDELQSRIRAGTERAHLLSGRLDAARERVQRWEKREAEWQARTSGRIRTTVISALCVLLAFLCLFLLRIAYLNSNNQNYEHPDDVLVTVSIPFHVKRVTAHQPAISHDLISEDPRLCLFDEL